MDSKRDILLKRLWPRMTVLRQRLQAGMQGGLGPLAALSLTVPQAMALMRLAERGPQTISELQKATGRSQAATSHLVATLERKKLARRADDAADGRRTRVHVTAEALRLVRQVEGLRQRTFEQALAAVPTALVGCLDTALADVLHAMEEPS